MAYAPLTYDAMAPDPRGETTDADLARDAVDDLRSAARQFADAWKVARRAIKAAADAGYDWTIDDASETYAAMQGADDACARYADAIEANINDANGDPR